MTMPLTAESAHRSTSDALLQIDDLRTHFFTRDGVVKAVDGVTIEIKPGETVGLVGESVIGPVACVRAPAWSGTFLTVTPAPRGDRAAYRGAPNTRLDS